MSRLKIESIVNFGFERISSGCPAILAAVGGGLMFAPAPYDDRRMKVSLGAIIFYRGFLWSKEVSSFFLFMMILFVRLHGYRVQ